MAGLSDIAQVDAGQGISAFARGRGMAMQEDEAKMNRDLTVGKIVSQGAISADTPEKWSGFVSMLQKRFPQADLTPFQDFSTRQPMVDQLRNYASERSDEAANQRASASNARADRNFEASRADAAAAQANADRNYKLAERNSSAKGYDVRTITNADGTTSLVRIDLSTGAAAPIESGGQPVSGGTNPYATGKFNEGQGKAATFGDRMAASNKTITEMEGINNEPGGWTAGMANRVLPDAVTNQFNGPGRQRLVQAQRDFLNAILRRESGAAISASEFANGASQYFPQPGDSPQVLTQKSQNRKIALEGIMREAGPSYRPPAGYGGAAPPAGGQGGMTPPAGGRGAGGAAATDPRIDQARAAISRGADPAAVKKRLMDMGIDPGGL